jgi:hypothetical protein
VLQEVLHELAAGSGEHRGPPRGHSARRVERPRWRSRGDGRSLPPSRASRRRRWAHSTLPSTTARLPPRRNAPRSVSPIGKRARPTWRSPSVDTPSRR